jgi:hypothetical protein
MSIPDYNYAATHIIVANSYYPFGLKMKVIKKGNALVD